jgi:hypothetical protein
MVSCGWTQNFQFNRESDFAPDGIAYFALGISSSSLRSSLLSVAFSSRSGRLARVLRNCCSRRQRRMPSKMVWTEVKEGNPQSFPSISCPFIREGLGAVVSRVNAAVIHRSINSDPICVIDSSSISCRGAVWKCAGYFYPAALFPCDNTDFSGNFGEVLVLTER